MVAVEVGYNSSRMWRVGVFAFDTFAGWCSEAVVLSQERNLEAGKAEDAGNAETP